MSMNESKKKMDVNDSPNPRNFKELPCIVENVYPAIKHFQSQTSVEFHLTLVIE